MSEQFIGGQDVADVSGLTKTNDRKTPEKITNAEPIRCKNPGDDGESMEAAALTGQSSVAAASTNDRKQSGEAVGTEPLRELIENLRKGVVSTGGFEGDVELFDIDGAETLMAEAADAMRDALAVSIPLTPAEIQSGIDRVRWAENLIRQLPEHHEGRNSWLLNFGIGPKPPEPNRDPIWTAPDPTQLAAVGEGAEPVGYTSAHELVRIKKKCMGRFADVSDGDFTVALYTAPPPSPDELSLMRDTLEMNDAAWRSLEDEANASIAALQAENERLTKIRDTAIIDAGNFLHRAEASEALVADMRDQLVWPKTMDPDVRASLLKRVDAILSRLDTSKPEPSPVKIEHDGFEGELIGRYVTREGKRGVVLQQIGTRVVHVYGEKWLTAAQMPPKTF